MLSEPPEALSLARMVAVSCVGLTKVVARGAPLTWTTELPAKLAPVAVSVKALPPAVTVLGLMLVRVGAGGGAVTARVTVLDTQPVLKQEAGLVTATATVPMVATSAAWTAMAT